MASRTDCAVAVSGISHATSARHAHVLTEYLSRTKRTPAVSAVKSETLSPCGVPLTAASPRCASAESVERHSSWPYIAAVRLACALSRTGSFQPGRTKWHV